MSSFGCLLLCSILTSTNLLTLRDKRELSNPTSVRVRVKIRIVWYVASVNGEVCGIYVLAGGSKCSVVIADWLVCIAGLSGLELVFLFFLFFCSIGFQMVGNLNDTPLMWCLFSSE